jgi:hypothetical protein
MPASVDEFDTLRKLLEVVLLRRQQRMLAEERYDRLQQVSSPTYHVAVQMLAMVVVPPIRDHLSDTEEPTKPLQRMNALRALRDSELVSNLVAEFVASSPRAVLLSHEADREASFSVYKPDHPATELDQPFLLVFRTRHVVTVRPRSDVRVVRDTPGFPAYGQMRTTPLLMWGATIRLRQLHTVLFRHVTLGRL